MLILSPISLLLLCKAFYSLCQAPLPGCSGVILGITTLCCSRLLSMRLRRAFPLSFFRGDSCYSTSLSHCLWLNLVVHLADLTKSIDNLLVTDVETSSRSKLVYGSKCLMLDERDHQEFVSQSSPSKSTEKKILNGATSSNTSPRVNQHHYEVCNSPKWCPSHSNGFIRSSGSKDDPFITSTSSTVLSSKGSLNE